MHPRLRQPLDQEATWATIRTTLDYLFTFPEDISTVANPPVLSPAEYSSAYTAVCAWTKANGRPDIAADLYSRLEDYLANICVSLSARIVNAPKGTQVDTYAALYRGFARRAVIAGHLTQFMDRHYTDRAQQEKKGWFRDPCHFHGKARKDKEEALLRAKWELPLDASRSCEQWKKAVVRAGAGSDLHPVPIVCTQSLALRKWRLTVLEHKQVDLILSDFVHTSTDLAAIEQLAESMKDVGIIAGDERRQKVDQLLKSVTSHEE